MPETTSQVRSAGTKRDRDKDASKRRKRRRFGVSSSLAERALRDPFVYQLVCRHLSAGDSANLRRALVTGHDGQALPTVFREMYLDDQEPELISSLVESYQKQLEQEESAEGKSRPLHKMQIDRLVTSQPGSVPKLPFKVLEYNRLPLDENVYDVYAKICKDVGASPDLESVEFKVGDPISDDPGQLLIMAYGLVRSYWGKSNHMNQRKKLRVGLGSPDNLDTSNLSQIECDQVRECIVDGSIYFDFAEDYDHLPIDYACMFLEIGTRFPYFLRVALERPSDLAKLSEKVANYKKHPLFAGKGPYLGVELKIAYELTEDDLVALARITKSADQTVLVFEYSDISPLVDCRHLFVDTGGLLTVKITNDDLADRLLSAFAKTISIGDGKSVMNLDFDLDDCRGQSRHSLTQMIAGYLARFPGVNSQKILSLGIKGTSMAGLDKVFDKLRVAHFCLHFVEDFLQPPELNKALLALNGAVKEGAISDSLFLESSGAVITPDSLTGLISLVVSGYKKREFKKFDLRTLGFDSPDTFAKFVKTLNASIPLDARDVPLLIVLSESYLWESPDVTKVKFVTEDPNFK